LEIKNQECDFSKINRPTQLEQEAGGWRRLSAKAATALNCYLPVTLLVPRRSTQIQGVGCVKPSVVCLTVSMKCKVKL
jgi:hypothetical protein